MTFFLNFSRFTNFKRKILKNSTRPNLKKTYSTKDNQAFTIQYHNLYIKIFLKNKIVIVKPICFNQNLK